HEYIAFAKLGEQLKSDIVYLELLGQKIIVLNSAEIVSEIMEKRSALYSDRPPIPMVTDPTLMNWSSLPTMTGYNDLWRHYRRILNNWLNARAVTQFDDLQERQARLLLRRLLGATDQAQAFERVRNEFYFGVHQPSITSSLLQDHTLLLGLSTMEKEERVKEVGFTMFGGGTDTSAGFLVNLVAAMVSNPHAQAIAQQELDTVLGQGVLPSITDKERLPYIRNLIDEVFRLYPVIPLGRKDSAGKEVLPQIELERNSLMLELKPFDFELKPRSDAHYRLITGTIDE
ncbi:unnamed protein product, partial [Rhizoctonia solani]